jgi:hypothetical protein
MHLSQIDGAQDGVSACVARSVAKIRTLGTYAHAVGNSVAAPRPGCFQIVVAKKEAPSEDGA